MIWALIGVYLYAGIVIFMAQKDDIRELEPIGKLLALGACLFFWPALPVLVAISDD
jgi:threonine/homoserine efflux transporter RhtA